MNSFLKISYLLLFCLDDVEIRHDEYHRKGASINTMSKLNTVFKEGKFLIPKILKYFFLAGTVTAGNASGFVFYFIISIVFIFL